MKIKLPSNRNFGIVFFLFFLVISLWPLLSSGEIRHWSFLISIIFLVLGIINSKVLTPLNRLWIKFGILLGKIVSPVVMGIIFFIVVTPISLILKVIGKDTLNLKKNNSKSYWIQKEEPKSSMKDQF